MNELDILDMSIYRFCSGDGVHSHQHAFWQFLHFVSGQCVVSVGEQSLEAAANTLVLVPPCTAHSLEQVQAPVIRLDVMVAMNDLELEQLLKQQAVLIHTVEDLTALLWRAKSEWDSSQTLKNHMAHCLFVDYLIQTLRLSEPKPALQVCPVTVPVLDGLAGHIQRYMQTHCITADFSLQKMSEALCYSPDHLSRVFKSATGKTIARYANELRVDRSIGVMRSEQYSLSEISRLSGFRDIYYFSRVFKQITGVAPHELRDSEQAAIYADGKNKDVIYRYYGAER